MKTYTLPVIGLMTLGASAFAAAAPSTGNSLPARDNFSACKWLGDRFKWFNSERDHKNPYIQEFNVSLRMQYGLDWIDPNGEGRLHGVEGRAREAQQAPAADREGRCRDEDAENEVADHGVSPLRW